MESTVGSKKKKLRKKRRRRRTFTAELRREAVRLLSEKEDQLSLKAVAKELGVHPSSLCGWRQQLEGKPAPVDVSVARAAAEPLDQAALERENRELRKRIERLEEEREILKRATAFFAQESD